MKRIIPFLIFVFVAHVSVGQNLNSAEFHTHREALKNSWLKFQNEKKGRVAFLGGSITFNPGWRDSVCNYLEDKFPETEFEFIAAGIPSMGSTPAAFRFERDVLKNGPVDLLFEEAAVNDDTNGRTTVEMIRGMEGIVRHARSTNPRCDIVIMHFVDPGKMQEYREGKVPVVIQQHEKVANHYNISTINLAKEVTNRIDKGEFDWENDFVNLHPSPFGQGVYARSIIRFLEDEFNKDLSAQTLANKEMPEPLDAFCYDDGKLILPNPPKSIKGWEFVKNWQPDNGKGTRPNYTNVPMLVGEYPGKIIKFQFKGNAVGIAVAAGPDAGIIEYSIDDQPWQKQDLFTQWSSNLYLPWYFTLESGLKNRKHTIQIRLSEEKNPESTGRKCVLRYFYYN
uniref:GDSL-type esterase/lipase family protein n=1 Tax=uncultured Draconibacterium sp. TaxID=1573823 RepID=UPI003216E76B